MVHLTSHRGTGPALVFALSLVGLLLAVNTTGYEGDDLNTLIPMLSLPEALAGQFELYKYDWQPLSYWLGWFTYHVTGSVNAPFLLPSVAIATALAMLYHIVVTKVGLPAVLFAPLVLMFPEILYSGLYFNTSALAYPFAVLGVLLAFERADWRSAVATGVTLALAVFMRLDFALVVPAIVLFRLYMSKDIRDALFVVAVGLVCLGLAFVTGVLNLEGLLDVYATSRAEIIANADGPGWNTRVKLMVATTIFSPLGWLLFILGAGFTLRTKRGVFWLWALVIFISLIPFLMALRNLLSVKYMMPIFALLPTWAAMLWMVVAARLPEKARRGVQALWITASVLLCLIAVEPDNAPPYIVVTAQDARQIGTHDGRRTWGAYAWQLADVARQNPTPKDAGAAQVFVTKATSGLAQDVWLVGPPNVFGPGGLGWRHIYLALEKAGWQGAPIGDGRVRFDVPGSDIILSLDTEGAPDTACVLALQDVRDPATALTNTCQN